MTLPASAPATAIPWQRGVAWLLFLGPFFFISYGFANNMAARWQVSEAHVYDWERHIPFIPWTIVPYWSIDLLYGLSFLLPATRREMDRHALRLTHPEPARIGQAFRGDDEGQALAGLAQRTMRLQCTIQEGLIWLGDDERQVELKPEVLFDEAQG